MFHVKQFKEVKRTYRKHSNRKEPTHMPNYCTYEGVIVAPKETAELFITIMNNGYDYNLTKDAVAELRTLGVDVQTFGNDNLITEVKLTPEQGKDASITAILSDPNSYQHIPKEGHFYRIFECDEYETEQLEDGKLRIHFGGNCAWSLSSCLTQSGYYGRDTDYKMVSTGTCIEDFAKNHPDVNIELLSYESGCCFTERFTVEEGEFYEEVEDYYEDWDEETNETSFESDASWLSADD